MITRSSNFSVRFVFAVAIALTCVTTVLAAPFSNPTQISGNTLWLDAADTGSLTIATGVSSWADKSTLGMNTVIQGTGGEQPASGVNSLGGKNVLTFDGNDRLGKNGGTLPLAANDDAYTYFAVWRPHTASRVETPYEQAGGGAGARSSILRVNTAYGFNGQGNDAHNLVATGANVWRLTAMRVDNLLTLNGTNNIFLTDNGTLTLGTTSSPATLAVGTTGIGVSQKVTNGGERLDGDIAEIIVYDSLLSDGSVSIFDNALNDVQFYLDQKWSLGLELSATPSPPTPEPSTFALGLLAFAGAVVLIRRRRRTRINYIVVSLVAVVVAFNVPSALAAPISNPTQISGNTLWLDAADTGSITIATGVSSWADKSTLGMNTVIQGTGGEQPASGSTTLGGKNVLTFDGNDRLGKSGGTLPLAANDDAYTYFAVWRPHRASATETPYEQAGGGGGARASILRTGGDYGFNGEGNDAHDMVLAPANVWRLTAMRVDNLLTLNGTNNIFLTDNGTLTLGTTGNPAGLAVGTTGIGVSQKVTNGGERLDGDIAEIIVYDSLVSDGSTSVFDNELNDVQFYLDQKWQLGLGFTATPSPPTPEPSTLALGLLALGGLVFATRQRRRRRSLPRVASLVLVGMMCFVSLGTPAYAALVGQWTFEPGEDLIDKTGNWNDLELKGDATITANGELDVNGGDNFATGWAASTGAGDYTGPPIGNKTLVSWLTMQGLQDVARSGSALTIDTRTGDLFDGIVFSEQMTNLWMNGSNGFSRTQSFPSAETLTGNMIQMAITYQDLGGGNVRITGYRDGVQIGQYDDNPFGSWAGPNVEVLFGKRHGDPNSGSPGGLEALIEEARIYTDVLSGTQLQALTPFKAIAVPEPSTFALGLLGLTAFGLLFRHRRNRR